MLRSATSALIEGGGGGGEYEYIRVLFIVFMLQQFSCIRFPSGITVLLTIMGAHTQTGWSQFTDESTAQNFVNYIKSQVVDLYGLDGIDIDDEYSLGHVNNPSLAMVTTLMKQSMPDKLITKALWNDSNKFAANWNNHTLGANLDYGWQMSYYRGSINSRLGRYTAYMKKSQLCLGFSAEQRFSSSWPTVGPVSTQIIADGYAGGMMFAYENQPDSLKLMKAMVDGMDGPGSWNCSEDEVGEGEAIQSSTTFHLEQPKLLVSVTVVSSCCIIVLYYCIIV